LALVDTDPLKALDLYYELDGYYEEGIRPIGIDHKVYIKMWRALAKKDPASALADAPGIDIDDRTRAAKDLAIRDPQMFLDMPLYDIKDEPEGYSIIFVKDYKNLERLALGELKKVDPQAYKEYIELQKAIEEDKNNQ